MGGLDGLDSWYPPNEKGLLRKGVTHFESSKPPT